MISNIERYNYRNNRYNWWIAPIEGSLNNNCVCRITYNCEFRNTIRYCHECKSSGGSLGNVIHNVDCKYKGCNHNKDVESVGKNYWDRETHCTIINKCRLAKTLNNDIDNVLKKFDKKLEEKVIWLILQKTGRLLFK